MKASKKCIDLIKHFEGLHDGNLKLIGLQPKKCPAGIWTEGYGHAMRDSKGKFIKTIAMPKATISTEAQAIELLKKDLLTYELIVVRKVDKELNQNQFDALVSYTYNTGGSDTLFDLINGNASEISIKNWFTQHYITGGGKVQKGLVLRRKKECELYFEK